MTHHRTRPNPHRRALVAWGALAAAVGISAVPLVQAWRAQDAPEPTPPLSGASAAVSATRLVVDLKDNATAQDIAELNAKHGLNLKYATVNAAGQPVTKSNIVHADLKPGQSMDALIAALKADERVEAAEPDVRYTIPEAQAQFKNEEIKGAVRAYVFNELRASGNGAEIYWDSPSSSESPASTSKAKSNFTPTLREPKKGWSPNDAMYSRQWNFRMVGAERAWKRSRGAGVIVAVLDTGVAAGHKESGVTAPDFAGTEFVPGYNFIDGDEDTYDAFGHGTHVAGTIAETTNNREGVAGLAPEATIMPVKVLADNGGGTSEGIAQGIRWAVDNGANIINMSLGSSMPSDVIRRAVRYAAQKNVLVVCAAGNGFGAPVSYPAAFKGALAVSSVGPTGAMAVYSSYGPQVALAAPGGDRSVEPENGGILQSTITRGDDGAPVGGYEQFNGTSMAAPHVSAAAALLMSQGVHDASRVRDLLLRSAAPGGERLQYGAGILSADGATALARRWGWASAFKAWIWLFLILPLVWKKPSEWWSPSAWGALGEWWLKPIMGFAFWLGAFGPDWFAAYAGANSPLNLLAFSALAPAVAFWTLPEARGARVTLGLAAGSSLCLLASTWGGLLSPFTGTAMSWAALPWVLSNLGASVIIAGASWVKAQSSLR